MANIRWIGGAAPVAEVLTYTFAGTWEATDIIRITIGSKTKDFVAGSTTISAILSALVAAFNLLDSTVWPEFTSSESGMTASAVSPVLSLTANAAGVPIYVTITPLETNLSAADAQTIEGAGVATTGTIATANQGPEDWTTVGNWSGGALPTTGDHVYIDRDAQSNISYGLAQSGVTLASLNIDNPRISIGLSKTNSLGTAYPESRPDYLAISATTLNIFDCSGLVKIDLGSVQTTANIFKTGRGSADGAEAVILKGTHASNTINANSGEVGIAPFGGETSTVNPIRLGQGATVRLGAGVTITTAENGGGVLLAQSAITTSLINLSGETTIRGTGAVAQLYVRGGSVLYQTSGTLGGNTVVSGDGTLSFNGDPRAKTVTNPIEVYGTGSVIDDDKVVNSGGNFVMDLNETAGGSISIGANCRLTRSAIA